MTLNEGQGHLSLAFHIALLPGKKQTKYQDYLPYGVGKEDFLSLVPKIKTLNFDPLKKPEVDIFAYNIILEIVVHYQSTKHVKRWALWLKALSRYLGYKINTI